MEPLTPAQQQLYDYLVAYIGENQQSPSIRQMMQAMDLKSPAPVQARLALLRKKGCIDWEEGKARTVRLLRKPPQEVWLAWGVTGQGDYLLGIFDDDVLARKRADMHQCDYEYGCSVTRNFIEGGDE